MDKIGIITYDIPHLKTEQIIHSFLYYNYDINIYALPFIIRNVRDVVFKHRPDQKEATHPKLIADNNSLNYYYCKDDSYIDDNCKYYIITGANILSKECIRNKIIINCHPGLIPSCRGLDSFKWSIYHMKPLGITLHIIDENIDSGKILSTMETNVYKDDTIQMLARRHYENEIFVLSNFKMFLNNPVFYEGKIIPDIPRKRMPKNKELEMINQFQEYVIYYSRKK